ncbi:energy-coupling factor ABC transporter ATP-binding protein [Solibacillus sp. MA9]|uniref:Energy-coupling factor ABC transporter ATP-binding protein n=1 Tax=Solibacillus palustris TaxID=2908203 RepID=A0ABS9UCT6_9BACL|nr:ABC transporter ATP-binding protein [Solibacillus sp. MA9]MCH7321954.1 energy-coupling factor ABC transporter ATP-binding protein [Solibacillus sp. MA9]
MTESYFTFEHVSFQYSDGTQALHDLSLTIPMGKKVAILGENGSGKSTFFKLLMGLEKPSSGKIQFLNEPLHYSKKQLIKLREHVGFIFQEADNQLFASTVKHDILYGPINLKWPHEKIEQHVDTAIQLTELEDLTERPIHFLSGGQKKRVTIAGVYAMDPKLYILDEPTSSLDYYFSNQLTAYLDELDTENRTFLYSTHQVNLIYGWADHFIVFHKGQLLYSGQKDALFSNDALLKKAHIEKPWLVKCYESMLREGLIHPQQQLPRSMDELMQLMKCHTFTPL